MRKFERAKPESLRSDEARTTRLLRPSEVAKLPIHERREILEKQAASAIEYYERMRHEWEEWQGGDIVEY